MLSLSGLGLSLLSLWFCSEAQGRPHREEDSHCSNQDMVSLTLLTPGLVPHPLCPTLTRFLCISMFRGRLELGLDFAENFGSVLGPLLCLQGNTT